MIVKKKICKTCKTEQFIWKSGNCKNCSSKINPQKPIKKSYLSKKPTIKGLAKKEEKKEYTEKQFELFKKIYIEHPTKRCYECNNWVDGESSVQFHHCLYKGVEKYKKYALEEWNILLVCGSCHEKTHNSVDLTPKIKEYTEKLKEKYGT